MCRFKKDIRALEKEIDYFNTSYVSVQVDYTGVNYKPHGFQYILCVGSSKQSSTYEKTLEKFQYILCVGSRLTIYIQTKALKDFNTSYVSVQD